MEFKACPKCNAKLCACVNVVYKKGKPVLRHWKCAVCGYDEKEKVRSSLKEGEVSS